LVRVVDVKPAAPAARFVFVTMIFEWLVIGMLSPVLPKIILQFCDDDVARAAAISGAFTFMFAGLQFFAAPLLGVLSDRYGRRPVILCSTLGSALDCLVLAIAPNLWWVFIGRLFSSVTAASAAASAAYITDVTTPEKRASAFGLMGAAFGIGFTVGPAIGGILGGIGPRVPIFVAAALMFGSTLYGLFVLPESLAPEKRSETMRWSRANPIASLALLRRHRDLSRLVASLFCSNLAVQSFSVFVLYTIYRFGWGVRDNGVALAVFGALSVAASIVTGRLVKRFGQRPVVACGFALGAIGFLTYALAPSGLVFVFALPLTGLWAIAGPPVQAAMSHRVGNSEQGQLQGAIASMRSISLIVGPPFFAFVFTVVSSRAISPVTGLPWVFGAMLLIAAIAFALPALRSDEVAAE
jgi:DHA1 family tetracycline resistance protein-like MFS transporter